MSRFAVPIFKTTTMLQSFALGCPRNSSLTSIFDCFRGSRRITANFPRLIFRSSSGYRSNRPLSICRPLTFRGYGYWKYRTYERTHFQSKLAPLLDCIDYGFASFMMNDRRGISTSKDESNGTGSGINKENGHVRGKPAARKMTLEKLSLSKPMDADFEKYLTGEMRSSVEINQKPFSPPRTFPAVVGRDAKARYARTLLQKKEKARLKTAQTVHLALMGNVFICGAKLVAWISSGSSGMLSEFIHSVVDCGNQGLLLLGLRDSRNSADRAHPYGYGKVSVGNETSGQALL